MEIKQYQQTMASSLHLLLVEAGEEWQDYYHENKWPHYQLVLQQTKAKVIMNKQQVIGYVRYVEDYGYGVYIYDLLVHPQYRGQGLGNKLMRSVKADYPTQEVYVMSDVDGYYKKIGYSKVGSLFQVK